MKITAITRYKHGALYAVLHRIDWTQSELARKTGLTTTTIGSIINLVRRPSVEQADAIQRAIAEAGEYLDVLSEWPETFAGLPRGYTLKQTADVELDTLVGNREALMIAAPEREDTTELDAAIEDVISELTPRQQIVLKESFWNDSTLEQIGSKLRVQKERVRQIKAKAIRRIREPLRLAKLKAHVDMEVREPEPYDYEPPLTMSDLALPSRPDTGSASGPADPDKQQDKQ